VTVSDGKQSADVFLSYGRARRAETERLAKFLESAGFSTWWDIGLLPGDRFRDEIDQNLNGCKAAIIIWSPEAIKSDWVLAEADHAWQLKKLVNVHVPGIDPIQIPKPFNQSHSVEIANHRQIVEAIQKRIASDTSANHAQAVAPATASTRAGKAGPKRHWVRSIAGVLVAALIGLSSLVVWRHSGQPAGLTPHWDVKGNLFVGQSIPLAWTYDGSTNKSGSPVLFEIASAANDSFESDNRIETYADGTHKFIGRINATRFWRVRAVDSGSKAPLSNWSDVAQISQYDSSYDRIKATHKLLVYVSNAENQGFFKWVNDKGFVGFDISLAKLLAAAISKKLGSPTDLVLVPVPWSELLDKPGQGQADLLISSISKRDERKPQFRIEFSDTYYCATQALIFRSGTTAASIRDMMAGKTVGVQDHTTNQQLAADLAKASQFNIKPFATTENLVSELLQFNIDLGLVDTPFAFVAQLQNRIGNRDRLSVKEFSPSDFPPAVPMQEQSEEYAVAVRSGEAELLGLVDQTIAGAKQDGSLVRLLDQAYQDYAASFGSPADRSVLGRAKPWNCPRKLPPPIPTVE
jgi:ABC-type amino acid transport substrate-binding protein